MKQLSQESFDLMWPFIKESYRSAAEIQKVHSFFYDNGMTFVTYPFFTRPEESVAEILLEILGLSDDVDAGFNMREQLGVWVLNAELSKEETLAEINEFMADWQTPPSTPPFPPQHPSPQRARRNG